MKSSTNDIVNKTAWHVLRTVTVLAADAVGEDDT